MEISGHIFFSKLGPLSNYLGNFTWWQHWHTPHTLWQSPHVSGVKWITFTSTLKVNMPILPMIAVTKMASIMVQGLPNTDEGIKSPLSQAVIWGRMPLPTNAGSLLRWQNQCDTLWWDCIVTHDDEIMASHVVIKPQCDTWCWDHGMTHDEIAAWHMVMKSQHDIWYWDCSKTCGEETIVWHMVMRLWLDGW